MPEASVSNEARFKVIDMKMPFYSRAIKLIFTTEVLLFSLVLKVRVFVNLETAYLIFVGDICSSPCIYTLALESNPMGKF